MNTILDTKIEQLQHIIDSSNNIVMFGGAGTSTDCGLPDFRGTNGLYTKPNSYKYPPETMLSHNFYKNHTEEFFEYYRNEMIFDWAEPNEFHKKLVELEEKGKLKAIVTQNIGGLHQKAGSKNVIELHGSSQVNYCEKCKKHYTLDRVKNSVGVPYCECGGIIRPDVTLYGENLNDDAINRAIGAISGADALIVAGTSLTVYPAAYYLDYFTGKYIVIINKGSSNYKYADLVINKSVTDVFKNIKI